MKGGDKPNHLMLWSPQDWQGSALRMELILEGDHVARLVYLEVLGKLYEEGGYIPRASVSGVCGVPKAEAERAIDRLLQSPTNLRETPDGMLYNPRVLNDLGAKAVKRENLSHGAKKGWATRRGESPSMESDGIPSNPNQTESDGGKEQEQEQEEQDQVAQVVVEKEVSTYRAGEQMALACIEPVIDAVVVERPKIEPPRREEAVRQIARRFLLARSLRLYGDKGRREFSAGTVSSIAKRIDARLRDGFEPDLLVALPALVEDRVSDGRRLLDMMLKNDPEVLLREDNAQGGKCHARRIEGNLDELVLNQKQVDILKAVDSWEWAKTRIKVREGVC